MRIISIDLSESKILQAVTPIRQAENKASELQITLSNEFTPYDVQIRFKLNENIAYTTPIIVPENDVITYTVTNALTFESGTLNVQVLAVDTATSTLVKSAIFALPVIPCIEGVDVEVPNDYLTYVQLITHYMDKDIYDPQVILGDAFDMENMTDGITKRIFTDTEKTKLSRYPEYFIGEVEPLPDTIVERDATGGIKADVLELKDIPTSGVTVRKMAWDTTYKCMQYGLYNNVGTHQVGQEENIWVKNNTLFNMPHGSVVYITGTDGEIPTVAFADANDNIEKTYVCGVVGGGGINSGSYGYVVAWGLVHNIDTTDFNEGDILWLSTITGELSNTMPVAPAYGIRIGTCVKKATLGKIFVDISRKQGAEETIVNDIGGYFTGAQVEAILQEIGGLIKRSYAEIYVFNGASVQSIPSGATYTKITPFMANGTYLNCTPDAANQRIVITENETYRIDGTFNSQVGTNGTILETAIFKNGVQLQNATIKRTTNISTPSSGSVTGFVACNVGDVLDVRVRHDKGSAVDLTVIHCNLNINKV